MLIDKDIGPWKQVSVCNDIIIHSQKGQMRRLEPRVKRRDVHSQAPILSTREE